MPSMEAVAPSPSHNKDGREKVRTVDKRFHRHKPFNQQGFISVLWLHHAQLRKFVQVWALTGVCSPPVGECSPPDGSWSIFFRSDLCRFRSKFAWALPLFLSSPWTMIFFQKQQLRTRRGNWGRCWGRRVKFVKRCSAKSPCQLMGFAGTFHDGARMCFATLSAEA